MDEFASDARKISNILNLWDFGYFVGALRKHKQENSHRRIQLVLQEYFQEKDATLLPTILQNDTQTIKDIFPEVSFDEITALLEEIGNEENRVRIVVKKILKRNNNMWLKRIHPGDSTEDVSAKKKTKIDNINNNTPSTTGPASEVSASAENSDSNSVPVTETNSANIDSQATSIYSFDNKNYETAAELNEVTAEDQDILLSIIETNLNVENPNDGPSSTTADHSIEDVISTNCVTPKAESTTSNSDIQVETHEVSYVSNAVLKIAKVTSTKDLPSQKINAGDMDLIDLSNTTERFPATEPVNIPIASRSVIITNPFDDTKIATTTPQNHFNNINIMQPHPVALTGSAPSEQASNGEFHLYKHLMEIFSNVSRKDVKLICKRYKANKHTKPSDNIFSHIVSDLLELTSSSKGNSSDDSENFLQVRKDIFPNQTNIVTPANPQQNQPMQQQPLVQLLAARNTLEHPIDLVSKTPTTSTSVPVFTVTQNNMITSNTVNVFTPGTLNTPRIRAPIVIQAPDNLRNHVDDVIDDILTDLRQSAADSDEDGMEIEEAAGDNRLVYHLMEMFPEACPQYIRQICTGKTNSPGVLDELISLILERDDYPRRKKAESPVRHMDPEEQLELLKQILTDADPSYLQIHCDRLIDKPELMKEFIANAVETHQYPKLKDYLRKQQISAQQKQYTSDFSVENFLEVIPDPIAYFKDAKRKQSASTIESQHYALCFLRNHFNRIPLRSIRDSFKQNHTNFSLTYKALSKFNSMHFMRSKRGACRMPDVIQDIPLLQEIAYITHQAEIHEYKRMQKVKEDSERAAAKAAGQLQTCTCCYDEEVMPKDVYTCENGCIFCKECVRRGAEVAFGDGKLDFICLNDCKSHFSLQTLQAVLKPKMFSIVAIKKQLEEVKAAGIEDLEMCPFCDFATIPAKDDKLFRCLNPDCMKESCRLCKEPSHVPLRCDEVEKEDEVKIRTYIENKMTEALLRTCYKCNKKFIKAEGCNKMTCSCGALMCYVCGQPVKDYKHFNGPGGDQHQLCPLYSDTNQLHQEAVLKGAEEAKREVGVDANPSKLKHDPAADLPKQYLQTSKNNPPPQVFQYNHPYLPFGNLAQVQARHNELPPGYEQRLQERVMLAAQQFHQHLQQNHPHLHHHHH